MSKTRKDVENLFELSPEALFLEDREDNILDVNEQVCKLLDYEREELFDMEVEDLVPEYIDPEKKFKYLFGHESPQSTELIEKVTLNKKGDKISCRAENTKARLKQELSDWNEESSLLDFPLTLAMGVSHRTPDQKRASKKHLRKRTGRCTRTRGDRVSYMNYFFRTKSKTRT